MSGPVPPQTPDGVIAVAVAAAQAADQDWIRSGAGSGTRWTAVPDDQARRLIEAVAPHIRAEAVAVERGRWLLAAPCPTPCDEDCELRPDGCHESHNVPSHRSHSPIECEELRLGIARAVAAERDRIRQLAIRHGAEYPHGDDGETCCDAECHSIWKPFADLIGGA